MFTEKYSFVFQLTLLFNTLYGSFSSKILINIGVDGRDVFGEGGDDYFWQSATSKKVFLLGRMLQHKNNL
jgi:hypothetical protein